MRRPVAEADLSMRTEMGALQRRPSHSFQPSSPALNTLLASHLSSSGCPSPLQLPPPPPLDCPRAGGRVPGGSLERGSLLHSFAANRSVRPTVLREKSKRGQHGMKSQSPARIHCAWRRGAGRGEGGGILSLPHPQFPQKWLHLFSVEEGIHPAQPSLPPPHRLSAQS